MPQVLEQALQGMEFHSAATGQKELDIQINDQSPIAPGPLSSNSLIVSEMVDEDC